MKIALVYDRVNKIGGAERVLTALHEIWPEAPLYTSVYNEKGAPWAGSFKVVTSFLNKAAFFRGKHEMLPLVTPYAFESFNFDDFDVVLSVTSQDAKVVMTKPSTLHICYCLTPTRYLWSGYEDYKDEPGRGFFNPFVRLFMGITVNRLRKWDQVTAHRPDYYLAVSDLVKERIKKIYHRDTEVVYPPVETEIFKPQKKDGDGNYYLIVSRLVPYKKIDYAIRAFNQTGWKLKIIGRGVDLERLKKLAGKNVQIICDNLTDEKLCCYYQMCKALICPGSEDFGLTAVEAQACGKPVISFSGSGVKETVIPGKTGELYADLTEKSLIAVLHKSQKRKYRPEVCRANAEKFSKKYFQEIIRKKVEGLYESSYFCRRSRDKALAAVPKAFPQTI